MGRVPGQEWAKALGQVKEGIRARRKPDRQPGGEVKFEPTRERNSEVRKSDKAPVN